jgi:hypothetical protein
MQRQAIRKATAHDLATARARMADWLERQTNGK